MSYSASTEVFFGMVLSKEYEIDEDEISKAGFIPISYGNFVCGPVGKGIAIKSIRVDEADITELSQEFNPTELRNWDKLEQFLKERNIQYDKICWYCATSYG